MAEVNIRRTTGVLAGGTLAEALSGAGAVVLAILGLTQVLPVYMASIGTIVIGGALFLEGAATATRFANAARSLATEQSNEDVTSGATVESFGGVVGIVLGILALVGLAQAVLLPIALIVYGSTLLIGTSVNAGLNSMIMSRMPSEPRLARSLREAVSAANGAQVLVGLGAVVLGILALLQIAPLILTLVGLLSVGGSILLSGTTISSRLIAPEVER